MVPKAPHTVSIDGSFSPDVAPTGRACAKFFHFLLSKHTHTFTHTHTERVYAKYGADLASLSIVCVCVCGI